MLHESCFRRDRIPAIAALTGLLLSAGASAIQRSDDGAGQYLIVPFAVANGAYETLIEVGNAADDAPARALKLRVLDRDGQPRLVANLYLPRRATWAGGLTRQDGMARLITSSEACLLTDGASGIESVSEIDFDFSAGSLEVVEMGIAGDGPLSSHISEGDCSAIVDLWNDGAWSANAALSPPAGDVRVGVRIINVAKGTMYGAPATALSAFSDIVQHQPPGSAQPDLASTHGAGTAAGETRSVLCSDTGCVEDFWENPIDAASAALMTHEAHDRYAIADSLAAESEWVVTYPTRVHYGDEDVLGTNLVSLLVSDRSGQVYYDDAVYIPEMSPSFASTLWLDHERSVNLVNLRITDDQEEGPASNGVFGIEEAIRIPDWQYESLPDSGHARLGFESAWYPDAQALVAPSGRIYSGRPALVTTFTEYTNGVLPGEGGVPQRANYGSSGEVSTTVRIEAPET